MATEKHYSPTLQGDGLPRWWPRQDQDEQAEEVELLDAVSELPVLDCTEIFGAMESLLTSYAGMKEKRGKR